MKNIFLSLLLVFSLNIFAVVPDANAQKPLWCLDAFTRCGAKCPFGGWLNVACVAGCAIGYAMCGE